MEHLTTLPEQLAAAAAGFAAAPAIALDTEFLREKTYRAELCLVQLGDGTDATCVDPIAIRDLAPLAALLGAGGPVKVMHASRQDLEVLLPVAGLVTPVFDTQVAAALAGMPSQVGYGDLVKRVLGVELDKAHTRTDWSRRPLSAEQVEYALDDVRYLLPLKSHLEEQLDRLGRTAWLAEELAALADASQFTVAPESAWLRVKGLKGIDPDRERLARELGAWRERRAVDRNRPRGWILEDGVLREIVLRVPRTREALAAVTGMPDAVIRNCGDDLMECIRRADVPEPPPALDLRMRPDPELNALVKKLAAVNQAVAGELGLSPEILATRRDLEQLAAGHRGVAPLQGWRASVIGERLLQAL